MNTREDMEARIGALLDGEFGGEAAVTWLSQFDPVRLTAQQLAGAVDAVMARVSPFPTHAEALDCCGTGGDGHATYNISTAVAFVVAALGVPVAKHGNRAVTSRSGSADVLQALGVNANLSTAHLIRIFQQYGLCFLSAPNFHPGFARVAPLRKEVGKRTIFNLLGPLCNPARVGRQLIGVFAPDYCLLVAETCKLLGRRDAMVVHGADGTDELSVTGETYVAHLQNGRIYEATVRPQDAGLALRNSLDLTGGDATTNAQALLAVLDGKESAYADAVALNAGGALVVAGRATNLHDGVAQARKAIARGMAREKLHQLIEATSHV